MRPESGILRLTVVWTPEELRAGKPVRWRFTVVNDGPDAVALMFTSAQQGDVVLEADGVEHYRWSRDKYFAAVITERELAAGAELSFDLDDVLAIEPGTYSLVASVKAQPAPAPTQGVVAVSA